MAVWAMSFVMKRIDENGDTEVKPYLKVLLTTTPDDVRRVVEHERDVLFPQTEAAAEGWELLGDPAMFDFHRGHYETWQHYLSPAPAPAPPERPAHLRVVES